MRNRLDHQLETLNTALAAMGTLCEDAICAGVQSLLEHDDSMAQHADLCEQEIDNAEREIESLCLKLLLQQQPVARDLRTISSALKLISD
ncbi:MAG: phosphate transport system regulatory protein PhoU, partial [Oscillospiraceae bacterium]|nr:phosphate transport system regulatory protein PhoU [Oscillospiraceae bacterium]